MTTTIKDEILAKMKLYEKPVPNSLRSTYLSFTLYPESETEFKKRLLIQKEALIITYYTNGTFTERVWNASRMKPEANIFGHLRARTEYQQGKWQERGIQKVYVIADERL
jgi:hypothetical protein